MTFLSFIQGLELLIGIYFLFVIVWSYIHIVSANKQILTAQKETIPEPANWPSVSVLIPMYNEEVVVLHTLKDMFGLEYPGKFEVCVCDDGSTDSSFKIIKDRYSLEPTATGTWKSSSHPLTVIQQENSGRASALNRAFEISTGEYVISTDADTTIDPVGLRKLISIKVSNPELHAVGGSILMSNDKRVEDGELKTKVGTSPLVATQIVEYIRSFIYGRMGLNNWGGNIIVSGAFGVFPREVVERVGMWSETALAEDLDMTIKIRESGGKVKFIPDPVAWTEAPSNLKSWGNQRDRWYRGLTQALWKFRKTVFTTSPFDKGLSYVSLPHYFLIEWLSPIVQLLGLSLIIINLIWYSFNWPLVAIILGIAYLIIVGLGIWSIILEQKFFFRYTRKRDTLKMIGYTLIEPFWYGPLHVYYRLRGLVKFIISRDTKWGEMKRTGTKVAMILIALFVVGSPLEAQDNFVQSTVYSEEFSIPRTTFENTVGYGPMWATHQQVWNNGRRDDMVSVGAWFDFGKFGVHGSVGESLLDRRLIADRQYDGNVYFVWGPAVLQTGIRYLQFVQEDIAQYNQRIELYGLGKRLDLTYTDVPSKNVSSFGIKIHQYTESDYEWSVFANTGDELLDFPFIVGEATSIGGQLFMKINDFTLMMGTLLGSRNETTYIGKTVSLRYNF